MGESPTPWGSHPRRGGSHPRRGGSHPRRGGVTHAVGGVTPPRAGGIGGVQVMRNITISPHLASIKKSNMNNLNFWDGLDDDLKQSLLKQLRNLWTHTSTALEGNTLSLGETAFVIEEGLTVSGKPLKDHQEVVGHARAIDLIWNDIGRANGMTKEDLFALHQAVQTERILDIYKPVGNWKVEYNGTTAFTEDDQQVFLEYAAPEAVPVLMDLWLEMLNGFLKQNLDPEEALLTYVELHVSLVRIHPFFDGNGRMARLLANLPVIHSGWPPILIPKETRREYIRLLSKYELTVGIPKAGEPLLPNKELLADFTHFCRIAWQSSLKLVEVMREKQKGRNQLRREGIRM